MLGSWGAGLVSCYEMSPDRADGDGCLPSYTFPGRACVLHFTSGSAPQGQARQDTGRATPQAHRRPICNPCLAACPPIRFSEEPPACPSYQVFS